MGTSGTSVARYRKGIAAGVGWVAGLIALGVLHGTVLVVAEAVVAVATTTGVVRVENERKPDTNVS